MSYLFKPVSFANARDFIEYCDRNFQEVIPAEVAKYFPEFQFPKTQPDPEPTFSEPAVNPGCRGRLHRRVHYISAICGGGKTWVFRQDAIKRARQGKKSVIVQETKDQLEKLQEEFVGLDVKVIRVDGDTDPKNVTQRIRNLLASDGGLILLITHASIYSLLGSFKGKSKTAVFFDELPSFFKRLSINVPYTHCLLTEQIKVRDFNGIDGKVEAVNPEDLKGIAINEGEDDLLKLLQEMAWGLWSTAWDAFVNLEQYRKLENGEVKQLTFFFVLKPEVFDGWERFSIAAADFEDSDFFDYFEDKIEFVEDPLKAQLRKTEHTNGHQLEIVWGFVGSASKHSLQKTSKNGLTYLECWKCAVEKDLNGKKLLQHAHKGANILFDGDQVESLPPKPKGYNKYDHHTNVAIFSSPNPTPDSYRFMETTLGLDPNNVRRRLQIGEGYQILLRTAQRRHDSKELVTDYVLTQEIAEAKAKKFAGCRLRQLQMDGFDSAPTLGKYSRPRKFESNSEKKRDWRKRVKAAKAAALSELKSIQTPKCSKKCPPKAKEFISLQGSHLGSEYFSLNSILSNPNNPSSQLTEGKRPAQTELFGFIYPSKASYQSEGRLLRYSSNEAFVADLEKFHDRPLPCTENDWTLSPAVFQGSNRKRENILFLRYLALDFEDGHLSPEEFSKLFPDLQMIIFNSAHHTFHHPRFHVIILLDHVLTPEAYERIWDRIALKLKDAGYWVQMGPGQPRKDQKRSGLDPDSRKPTQLMRAPCQTDDGIDSFFHKYIDGRKPLDPVKWIENDNYIRDAPRIDREAPGKVLEQGIDLGAIDRAKADYRATQPRGFNHSIGVLAGRFEAANMHIWSIESELMVMAKLHHGKHPKDLYRDVSGLAEKMRQRRLNREAKAG